MRTKIVVGVNGPEEFELTAEENADADAREAQHIAEAPVREAQASINSLEATITDRRQREAGSDTAGGTAAGRQWMKDQMALIAIERSKM